jgi:phosphate-selective porin OprO/OprP
MRGNHWFCVLILLSAAAASARAQTSTRLPPTGETAQATWQGDAVPSPADTSLEIPSAEARIAELERRVAALTEPKPAPAPTLPSVKIGGAFQADAVWFGQDAASRASVGDIQDGADFRRARLGANGNVTDQVSYFFQMDFGAFGRPTFTDVWLAINDVPYFGNIKIGQWKQPFSLEVVSSYRYTTFMERSVLFQPFTPFRHLGIGFYDWSDDLNTTWAASVIATGQDQFGSTLADNGGSGVVGRVAHLLNYDEPSEGRYYTHLGGAYYFNAPPNDAVRFRTIPEMFVGEFAGGAVGTSGQAIPGVINGTPYFVDTGVIASQNVNTFGTEFLWVNGPLSVQSELMCAVVDRIGDSTIALPGGYAQIGFFLTGEHRPYDRKAGAIDRVIPFEDFFWVRDAEGCVQSGLGAVEVAGRISYIDLDAGSVAGGTLTDFTLGVNWYLNPYAKLVANYILASLDDPQVGKSETNIFAVRAQLDF